MLGPLPPRKQGDGALSSLMITFQRASSQALEREAYVAVGLMGAALPLCPGEGYLRTLESGLSLSSQGFLASRVDI